MTLKEKVMMMQPECIDNYHRGGVLGCPGDYPYLHEAKLHHFECVLDYDCEYCCNQEFVDKSDNIEQVNHLTYGAADVTRNLAKVSDTFICGKCGIHIKDCIKVVYNEDTEDTTYQEYEFKFCPECGRRVMEE